MKTDRQKLAGNYPAYYYVYPTGNRAYGGGGWSRRAKRRPKPELVRIAPAIVETHGKSVYLDGVRKLKVTLIASTGEVVREDYPIERILKEE